MPTLKQLTCHIEWANSKVSFKEYGVAYGDGSVECHIPIPTASTPFSIHLASNGFISSGLAMFVFMDGVYQCNRNKNGLICPAAKPGESSSVPRARDVGFRVRQKEEQLPNGKWVGKPWRFEPLRIVPDVPQIDPANFRELGSIVVIVLRCRSRAGRVDYLSDGSRTPESAMAFGPVLDDAASVSSDEHFAHRDLYSHRVEADTGFGENLGLLFDGGNDYEYRHGYGYNYANENPRHQRAPCSCRRCTEVYPDDVEEQVYAARNSAPAEPEPWDAYNPSSPPDADRIRKSYRHLPAFTTSRSVPHDGRNRRVHYERRHSYRSHRPDNDPPPLRCDPTARKEPIQRELYPEPDDAGRGGDKPQSVSHRCTPSVVLNVHPASNFQEACERCSSDQHQSHCPHGKTRRSACDGCYTISNGKRVSSHCCSSHSQRTCSKHENPPGSGEPPQNENNNNHDTSQAHPPAWGADNANQDGWGQTNGDSGAYANNQTNDNTTNAWPTNPQESNNNNNYNNDHFDAGNTNQVQPNWDSGNIATDTHNVVDMTNETSWQQHQPEDNFQNDNAQPSDWNTAPNDTANNDANNGFSQPWGENTPAWGENNQTWGGNTGYDNNNNNNVPNSSYEQTNNQQPPPEQFQAQRGFNNDNINPPAPANHMDVIPEFVIPVAGDSTGEPPLYTVPEGIAQAKSLSHQVQLGRAADYSHRVRVPEYFDTMEEPYAKFTFNYRVKESIESKFGVSVERDIKAEKKILESLPRDQIVNQLLQARGLLGGQNDNVYVLPNIPTTTTEPTFTTASAPAVQPPLQNENCNGNGNTFMPTATTTTATTATTATGPAHVDNNQTTNHVHWNDNPVTNDTNNNNSSSSNNNNNNNEGEVVTVPSRFFTDYNNNNHDTNNNNNPPAHTADLWTSNLNGTPQNTGWQEGGHGFNGNDASSVPQWDNSNGNTFNDTHNDGDAGGGW